MEKINFNYSLKNIPIASRSTYMKAMIDKCESLIYRMRWKAYFFEKKKKPEDEEVHINNYNFKSENTPPRSTLLDNFEESIFDLVSRIKFNKKPNKFQNELSEDVKKIKSSTKVYVPADKTTNLYKLEKEHYTKLLQENITKDYQKADKEEKKQIDIEAKRISKQLSLADKIECMAEKDAFLTLKDHKDNFINQPKCRLINPAKSQIGKISSQILKKINKTLRSKLEIPQWQNTKDALAWFKNINDKKNKKLLQLDIVEFYPSITEELLDKAINFGSSHTNIDKEEIEIIKHCRKSMLFNGNTVWKKKNSPTLFDVTMGSFDGAEVCELVGAYLLFSIKENFPTLDFGLYRDDGLGCYKNMPGPQMNKIKKDIFKFFKDHNLSITLDMNLTQVDFLDVTLNIQTNKFWPFKKQNSETIYINKHSNHPNYIKSEIPKMVNKRLCEISCNEEEFNKIKNNYEEALHKSGFKNKLKFQTIKPKKKIRKRKIIYFNPPYNENVNFNLGKQFISLIDKHFPKDHKFHKIFNRNTIKLSYSCMPNMKTIITNHNKKIMNCETTNTNEVNKTNNEKKCNCRNKNNCPLKEECLTEAIVYKATVNTTQNSAVYLGSCESSFKTRFYNHTKSFNNEKYKKETKLSTYIWDLKENEEEYTIEWEIVAKCNPYKCGTNKCSICSTEKLLIMKYNNMPSINLLNKRNEILNKCRHKAKFKLINIK